MRTLLPTRSDTFRRIIFSGFLLLNFSIYCEANKEPELVDLRVPVQVEEVKRGEIEEYVSVTGTLKSEKEVSVKTDVNGRVTLGKDPETGLRLKKGARVNAGHLVCSISNDEYVYQTRLEAKEKELEYAENEYENTKSLVAKGGSSVRELQTAEKTMINARFNLKQAKLELAKLKITAPIPGMISGLNAFADGSYLPAGTEICKVLAFKKIYIDLNITNDDIAKVKIGQDVKITNYSLEDQTFIGKVVSISPDIDPTTRTFSARVMLENENMLLKPGMFAKADIVVQSKKNVVLIPKYLILNRNNENIVFVVDKQEAVQREIDLGLDDGENVEVLAGVNEKERIVTRGFETLKDNTKVRISQ